MLIIRKSIYVFIQLDMQVLGSASKMKTKYAFFNWVVSNGQQCLSLVSRPEFESVMNKWMEYFPSVQASSNRFMAYCLLLLVIAWSEIFPLPLTRGIKHHEGILSRTDAWRILTLRSYTALLTMSSGIILC